MFSEGELELLQKIISQGLLQALGETLLMTFVPTILAFAIGLPLGILLVTGDEKGIHPLPRWLMKLLHFIINILRSVPFLILLIVVLPLSGWWRPPSGRWTRAWWRRPSPWVPAPSRSSGRS